MINLVIELLVFTVVWQAPAHARSPLLLIIIAVHQSPCDRKRLPVQTPPSCLRWNLQNRQRYRLQYPCILPLCCSQPVLCDSNKWRISVQKDQYCTLCLNASRAGPMLSCQLLLSCQNTSRTRLCGALKHAQAHPLLQIHDGGHSVVGHVWFKL